MMSRPVIDKDEVDVLAQDIDPLLTLEALAALDFGHEALELLLEKDHDGSVLEGLRLFFDPRPLRRVCGVFEVEVIFGDPAPDCVGLVGVDAGGHEERMRQV